MPDLASMMAAMGGGAGGKGGMPDLASMMAAMGGGGEKGGMPDMASMMAAMGKGGKGGMPDMESMMAAMGGGGKGGMPDMESMMAAMGGARGLGKQTAPQGRASLANPRLKLGPSSSPASLAAAMNEMAAQRHPVQSDAEAMAELRKVNRNSAQTIAEMRRQLGEKGDPLAAMATRAVHGNDPTSLLGREDKYVKSPQEAMQELLRTQAKEDALKAQRGTYCHVCHCCMLTCYNNTHSEPAAVFAEERAQVAT